MRPDWLNHLIKPVRFSNLLGWILFFSNIFLFLTFSASLCIQEFGIYELHHPGSIALWHQLGLINKNDQQDPERRRQKQDMIVFLTSSLVDHKSDSVEFLYLWPEFLSCCLLSLSNGYRSHWALICLLPPSRALYVLSPMASHHCYLILLDMLMLL